MACDFPRVGMPPETHFFSRFLPGLTARRSFPLEGGALREELAAYAAMETSRGMALDVNGILERLGERCRSPLRLFLGIVAGLSPEVPLLGEKTPEHLAWWRPLTRSLPHLKLVAVVRDPRAVMASHARVPWGIRSAICLGEQWSLDESQVAAALRELGPKRCLVLRYEDVAARPEEAGRRLGEFLGAGNGVRHPSPSRVVLDWEWWKQRALGPVLGERMHAWRQELDPEAAADITAVCRPGMLRHGYEEGVASRKAARARVEGWESARQVERRRFRRQKLRRQAEIERVVL